MITTTCRILWMPCRAGAGFAAIVASESGIATAAVTSAESSLTLMLCTILCERRVKLP